MRFIDIRGQTFGRLTVIERVCVQDKMTHWRCLCECGTTAIVESWKLRHGHSRSCGCLGREIGAKALTTHGHYGTPEYRVWRGMKTRCYNANDKNYARYGGRSIEICDEWRRDFLAFLRDMGRRPSARHSIDRIDNGKGYSADNCRWATPAEQNRNRQSNHRVTFRGRTKTVGEWAAVTGISHQTISTRLLRYGWTAERALTEPAQVGRRAKHT